MGDGMVTPTAISRYLNDLSFPATRQECIEHAEENGAPEEVLAALETLRDDLYDSLAEIWAMVGDTGVRGREPGGTAP